MAEEKAQPEAVEEPQQQEESLDEAYLEELRQHIDEQGE